jgi:hypothetical protein
VRVLLDESVARQLAPLLAGHEVTTVPKRGWSGISNGDLLRLAAAEFDALITGDRSLQYQQNLRDIDLGVIVLVAPDNRVETITSMAPQILEALSTLEAGQVVRVAV